MNRKHLDRATGAVVPALGLLLLCSATVAENRNHGESFAKTPPKKAKPPAQAPTEAIITQKLRETWEKPAPAGSDGAVTVEVQSVQIGQPRLWRVSDNGGGQPGTTVYPAKVHWTRRTHYRTRTAVVESWWIMSCFKNGFGDWVVQQTGEPGQKQEQRDEPSTLK